MLSRGWVAVFAEILVLGCGDTIQQVDPAVHAYLRANGVSLEVQDTVRPAPLRAVCGAVPQRPPRIAAGQAATGLPLRTRRCPAHPGGSRPTTLPARLALPGPATAAGRNWHRFR